MTEGKRQNEASRKKELIINPAVPEIKLPQFLSKLSQRDEIRILSIDPKLLTDELRRRFKVISDSEDADMVISRTPEQLKKLKSSGKVAGYYKKVLGTKDMDEIEKASSAGADFIVVEANDWKIIPLENIIAKLHKSRTKVFTTAKNSGEVATMFAVLELGVDGVILTTDSDQEIEKAMDKIFSATFSIRPAKIIEVRDVGTGQRVCVDTASMMSVGEGMLIGSRSNFMLLVHNESVGSSFTSPRPFRVNAGAVYCYTITPDGNTKYLSEIESGSEVWIVNKEGAARRAVVGRSKIETRPLRLLKSEIEGEVGTVILQNAETIRLISKDGNLISVTDIKPGDEVLGYAKPASGRHFGMEVDEYIVEK